MVHDLVKTLYNEDYLISLWENTFWNKGCWKSAAFDRTHWFLIVPSCKKNIKYVSFHDYTFLSTVILSSHTAFCSQQGTRMNHLITLCLCPPQPLFIFLYLSTSHTILPSYLSHPVHLFGCSTVHSPFCFVVPSLSGFLVHWTSATAKTTSLNSFIPYIDISCLAVYRLTVWALNELVNICPDACSRLLIVLLELSVTLDSENPETSHT